MAVSTRTETIQDPDIPVENLEPVELIEVADDEAEQPPDSWGQDGEGAEEPDQAPDGDQPTEPPAPADPADPADATADAGAEVTGGGV